MIDTNLTNWENRLKDYGTTLSKWLKESLQTSSSSDIRLGIWGTSGSGKTTYMLMLYEALKDSEAWLVELDPIARKFIRKNSNYLRQGFFSPPTETAKELEIFSYTLRRRISPGSKIILNFIDAPGEFYENILSAKGRVKGKNIISSTPLSEEENKTPIIDYLMSCDGIIFLLDPENTEKNGGRYSSLLEDLFLEFQERSKRTDIDVDDPRLEQYMTFCVTKVDRKNFWNYRKDAQPFVEKILGKWMSLKKLQNFCRLEELNPEKRKKPSKNNRCEFFCISSVGRYQKDGEWVSPVIYPEENGSIQPNTEQTESSSSPSWGYDEEVYSPQSSKSSTGDWASSGNQNYPDPVSENRPTIDSEAVLRPYNVLEPVEWLIKGIQANPPFGINRK